MSLSPQVEIFEETGLEMFLSDTILLLSLYRNGRKDKVREKARLLEMAKQYISNAIKGFKGNEETQRTRYYELSEETISQDTAYREALSTVQDKADEHSLFTQTLPQYVQILQKVIDEESVEQQDLDDIITFFKRIAGRIRVKYYKYLQSPVSSWSTSGREEYAMG